MLGVPVPQFQWVLSSESGTRPAAAYGPAVTPVQNSYVAAAWTEVLSSAELVNDVYGIYLNINSGFTSAEARDLILNIGVDETGGTTYAIKIPDLYASCSSNIIVNNTCGGIWYYFPLFVPAGSSIAAQASVNNATVRTVNVWAIVEGLPYYPDLVRTGSYVTAFGITAAGSNGTAVTPGTTNDGAWVSLGTTSTDLWWWQIGLGCNDATMNTTGWVTGDLAYGDGSTKIMIIEDEVFLCGQNESWAKQLRGPYHKMVPSGSELFVRAQSSGALDANYSMTAYGLGG